MNPTSPLLSWFPPLSLISLRPSAPLSEADQERDNLPPPDLIDERRADDCETLSLRFTSGGGPELIVSVPYVNHRHPDKSEAARLTRQRAKIILRWHAAGQPTHRLRVASACRTLGITGEDRVAVSRRPLPAIKMPRPMLGPAFVQPTRLAA